MHTDVTPPPPYLKGVCALFDFSDLCRAGEQAEGISGCACMRFLAEYVPVLPFEVRKFGVAVDILIDEGQVQPVGAGQGLAVDFTAADDEDFVDPVFFGDFGGLVDGLVDGFDEDGAFTGGFAAADHDMGAARQGFAAQRVPGLAAHDHRLAHGGALEMFEILGNVPRDFVVFPDHMVPGHRDNGGNLDIAHAFFIRESMDRDYSKIFLKDIVVDVRIGLLPEERTKKQRLIVNVEMFTGVDYAANARGDNIIDYAPIHAFIQSWGERPHTDLIESFVSDLADKCLAVKGVTGCKVSVCKADVFGAAQGAGVELCRCNID